MERIGKCIYCGNENGTIKIKLADRGNRNACICENCKNRMESYTFENGIQRGSFYKNPFSYSIELETMRPTLKANMELLNKGFRPTSDCTVDCEFKSPIFTGMKSCVAICNQTIQSLLDNEEIVIDNNCGTHFHVGYADNSFSVYMSYIKRFYHSLFVPLCEAMQADPAKTKRIFGRDFTYYASPININTIPDNHSNFINVQHDNTLEFRLMFFDNATQYVKAMHFCKKITEIIITNFCEHFNDNRDGENMTAYRKHKAKIASDKILKEWNKL